MLFDSLRGHIPVVLDGGEIRDGCSRAYAPAHPMAAGRFEDPGLGWIGNQETVVIAPSSPDRRPALAVILEKRPYDRQSLTRGVAAFQSQSDQVHTQEGRAAESRPW